MVIGIHAPYTFDAATTMATTLADLAMRLGLEVSYLACQAHDQGVHYRWDREVLGRSQNFELWASRCSHLVWFDVQPAKLAVARRLGGRNILVVLWHRLTPQDLGQLGQFDAVVCPSRACYRLLDTLHPCPAVCVPWDSGMPLTDTPQEFGGKRLYVPLDGATVERAGPLLLHALHTLLDGDMDAAVTLSHTRALPPAAYAALGKLRERHGKRVTVLRRPGFSARAEAYATHDWVVAPSLRANAGVACLEAQASRRPVLALDLPPANEIVVHGQGGLLLPCEVQYGPWRTPEGYLNAFDLQAGLSRIVGDADLLAGCHAHPWTGRRERRAAFELSWKALWELD